MPTDLPTSTAEKLLTIGEVSKACNATVRTLRYYEELDLICPESRTEGGYRLYLPSTIKRVNAILALQALHYSLEEIATLLGKASAGLSHASRQRRVDFTKTALLKQAAGITEKLTTLQTMQQELAHRLSVLTEHCVPCVEEQGEQECCSTCPHQEIHWN